MTNETEHILTSYDEALASINATILQMCGHVTEALAPATAALLDNDLQGAQAIIENDDRLDAWSIDLETECHRMLSLRNPMATDLRVVITAMKLNAEIERSGDLVSNIAKATRRIYGTKYDAKLRGIIVQMSQEATRLFSHAADAFADRNVSLAAALDDMDDTLDELSHDIIELIFAAHGSGQIDLPGAVQLALIARFYERIGDHAVNIGEQVQYMVTGWTPEHAGAERYRARMAGIEAEGRDDSEE